MKCGYECCLHRLVDEGQGPLTFYTITQRDSCLRDNRFPSSKTQEGENQGSPESFTIIIYDIFETILDTLFSNGVSLSSKGH